MNLQSPPLSSLSTTTTTYRFTPSLFRTSFRCRRKTTSSELKAAPEVPRFSVASSAPSHKVTVHDRQRDVVHEFYVPEDQYILHTAEAQDISLPFACRHGVSIYHVHVEMYLLGQGYALLCVGFPTSDIEVETQDEDEVYWLQFGRYFARGPIERDDYALELAMGDE
ncbi:ferredoxin C 2, chloroplastic [Tanacetum coccineum]